MLVKCQRCYGSNHYEQDCISSQLAGLNQIRPKCNFCRGWGHSVDHCPSSRRRTDGSNTPTQLQCLRCQGRLHPETRCTSPTDAGLLKIHPRCTQCEGWGHTPPRCPMTLTSSVVASQPTPPKETVDADVALRAQYLWSLSHAVSGEVNHAPDIQEKLSRFYVDKLLDAVIDDNVRVQEERKFCAHCSCLQVGNVTSITRLRVFKNIPKPTHWASMPKGTVLKGMVVHTCLRCGERFMEPGKMGKRVLIHKKEDEVQLRQVKKRKKKAQKLSASLKATSTKQAVQPQKGHSLQDFLKGL